MEHLTPLDDTFIVLERENLPMHIGGLLIFDGPAPTYEELLDFLDARLDRLPRYRQVIAHVPLHIGPPAWLDDQHFHLPYHVRHTAVPSPGDDAQLRTLAGRILSLRLDLDRPPWEMWLVEGLPDGRFALVTKVHHAMVDGLSGADLLEVMLDGSPAVTKHDGSQWSPRPWPNYAARVASSITTGLERPAQRLRELAGGMDLKSLAATVLGTVRLGHEMANTEQHLMGQPGPHRRWAWASASLSDIKAVKNHLGGTVNDVILTAIAGGFRDFLLNRGVGLVVDDYVRSMVPVSIRQPGAPTGGNEVAALFTDLPVGIPSAEARLLAVRERMLEVKSSGLLQGTESLVANAAFVPPALFAAAGKLAARAAQPMVATITTNVPGPQHQLYLLGRPLLRMMPYVPLGMNQLMTVAIVSYNGQLVCGITADYDRIPDIEVMSQGIERSLAELVALLP